MIIYEHGEKREEQKVGSGIEKIIVFFAIHDIQTPAIEGFYRTPKLCHPVEDDLFSCGETYFYICAHNKK